MKQEHRQLNIVADARLAAAFKSACKGSSVSMTKDLATYMEARRGGRRNAAALTEKQPTVSIAAAASGLG